MFHAMAAPPQVMEIAQVATTIIIIQVDTVYLLVLLELPLYHPIKPVAALVTALLAKTFPLTV